MVNTLKGFQPQGLVELITAQAEASKAQAATIDKLAGTCTDLGNKVTELKGIIDAASNISVQATKSLATAAATVAAKPRNWFSNAFADDETTGQPGGSQ
jgi:hypothetical protein